MELSQIFRLLSESSLFVRRRHHWLLYPLEFALHRKLGGLLIQLMSCVVYLSITYIIISIFRRGGGGDSGSFIFRNNGNKEKFGEFLLGERNASESSYCADIFIVNECFSIYTKI